MANIFKGFKNPTAQVGKSAFDLSQKHVFSSKIGQLLPVFQLETLPSDHIEIDMAGVIRSLTMNTAAFIRGKFHYDFFFVPYSQLWSPFNQFISQREDRHSMNQLQTAFCPTIDLGDLLYLIYRQSYNEQEEQDFVKDLHGFAWYRNVIRLLDLCGYGNYNWILDIDVINDTTIQDAIAPYKGKLVNVFRIAAYQHIFYDCYRNKQNDFDPAYLVADYASESAMQYFEEYGYTPAFNFDDIPCNSVAGSQIPVFQSGSTSIPNPRVLALFNLNYHQYKADIFTSSLPSQQFGAVSDIQMQLPNIGGDLGTWHFNVSPSIPVSLSNVSFDPGSKTALGSTTSGNTSISHHHVYDDGNGNALQNPSVSFDVLALKRAEALQKWKQNVIRAGNQVDDNFRAHFGVEPYYEGDNVVMRLGSYECVLNVNPVTATAATSDTRVNGKVGELGATGVSVVNGSRIEFDAKDFGVIMCIESYIPESEYQSNMIDKANRLFEPFDFPSPEFDNLGMDVVTLADSDVFDGDFVDYQSRSNINLNTPLGYVPMWSSYKTAVDKVHGEFALNVLEYGEVDEQDNPQTSVVGGSLSAWVAPRHESLFRYTDDVLVRSKSSFYINPHLYDQIFAVYANDSERTDCFLHNIFFKVSAVRPMSVLGLPNFN